MKTAIYLTVTTGRSGTNYLCDLFKIFPTFISKHEPTPNKDLHKALSDPHIGIKYWQKKLLTIENYTKSNYIETSHYNCKGYIEGLLSFGIVPNIIILLRDKRKIAKSFYELNATPARTILGNRHLPYPYDSNVLQINDWELLNDYQLCYWYCLEIERRQKYYKKTISDLGGKVYTTSAIDLQIQENFIDMANYFDIKMDNSIVNKYNSFKSIVVNSRDNQKINKLTYTDEELLLFENEVHQKITNG